MPSLLDILLPAHCDLCGLPSPATALCPVCAADLPRIVNPCARCAGPSPRPGGPCGQCIRRPPPWDRCVVPLAYLGATRTLVLRLKSDPAPALLQALVDAAPVQAPDAQVTVPVPSTRWRNLRRGFNPAELLARQLPGHQVPPVDTRLLSRRAGARQSGLDRATRQRNVRGLFTAHCGGNPPAHVLLIDDVMTSGATLAEATRTLRRAGVRQVTAYALARAII